MDEATWLASDNPEEMLAYLSVGSTVRHRAASDRKLRLFACGCCRQVWDLLTDDAPCPTCRWAGTEIRAGYDAVQAVIDWGKLKKDCPDCKGTGRVNRSRRAVEVAERYADGRATEGELAVARAGVIPARANSLDYATAYLCDTRIDFAPFLLGVDAEGRGWPDGTPATQAALLRDIVGNPFRRYCFAGPGWVYDKNIVELNPDIKTPAVLGLARRAYDARAWELLPILADALEDAGCTDAEILGHLRGAETCPKCMGSGTDYVRSGGYVAACLCDWASNSERAGKGQIKLRGPHCRGCWATDLILGKE